MISLSIEYVATCPSFRSTQLQKRRNDSTIIDIHRRHAELDLRSLKVTLGMDVLRGKSPKIVRKEIWAHLLAYNLIRSVMAQAAIEYGASPRLLSFKATLQTIHAFAMFLWLSSSSRVHALYTPMLAVWPAGK